LTDLDDIQGYYLDSGGSFLIITDQDQVVGTGGIHPIDAETCELKRLWLLKSYRGQGLGKQLTKMLLASAQQKGYRRVRLEVSTPDKQQPAVTLYQELGFQPIEAYNPDGFCELAMEKSLENEP
jgi:putative acetyltransferase